MKHLGKGNLNHLMSQPYNKKRQILNSYRPAPPKSVGIIPEDANVVFEGHANADFTVTTHNWEVNKPTQLDSSAPNVLFNMQTAPRQSNGSRTWNLNDPNVLTGNDPHNTDFFSQTEGWEVIKPE
ncbi:MAG: hypothetical protein AAGF06_01440 [Pseudomonadota bacterium]